MNSAPNEPSAPDVAPENAKVYRLDAKSPDGKQAAGGKAAPRWVPLPDEAFQRVLKIRAQVQKKTQMRPDLSIVVAALIEHAGNDADIADVVARYGLAAYTRAAAETGDAAHA